MRLHYLQTIIAISIALCACTSSTQDSSETIPDAMVAEGQSNLDFGNYNYIPFHNIEHSSDIPPSPIGVCDMIVNSDSLAFVEISEEPEHFGDTCDHNYRKPGTHYIRSTVWAVASGESLPLEINIVDVRRNGVFKPGELHLVGLDKSRDQWLVTSSLRVLNSEDGDEFESSDSAEIQVPSSFDDLHEAAVSSMSNFQAECPQHQYLLGSDAEMENIYFNDDKMCSDGTNEPEPEPEPEPEQPEPEMTP
jgi:hypothetical protein